MLGELLTDLPILTPGDIVRVGPIAVIVYPIAIWHTARFPAVAKVFAALADSDDAEALEAALLPTMLDDGLPLLTACCSVDIAAPAFGARAHSPAAALPSAIQEAAARRWICDSFAQHFRGDAKSDPEQSEDDGEHYLVPCSAVLTRLVMAGHSISSILHDRQLGFDSRPVPFHGWTLPQLSYWTHGMDAVHRFDGASEIEGTAVAIGGVLGGDDGSSSMREHVRGLRTIGV